MGDGNKVTITYETLFEILRQEKNKAEIQKLDDKFISEVTSYLESKYALLNSSTKSNIFGADERDNTTKQIINIKRILKELYDRREKKIISLAMDKARTGSHIINTGNLLEQEKKLCDSMLGTLMHYRNELLNAMTEINSQGSFRQSEVTEPTSKIPEEPKSEPVESPEIEPQDESEPKDLKTNEEKQDKTCQIRFLTAVPKFAGLDLEVYGPYEANDMAELPMEVADVLINKGRARQEN